MSPNDPLKYFTSKFVQSLLMPPDRLTGRWSRWRDFRYGLILHAVSGSAAER
jgi:hypothetical protein